MDRAREAVRMRYKELTRVIDRAVDKKQVRECQNRFYGLLEGYRMIDLITHKEYLENKMCMMNYGAKAIVDRVLD